MREFIIVGLIVAGSIPCAFAQQASFDCRRAHMSDEIAICSDRHLSELDSIGTVAFNIGKQRAGSRGLLANAQALLVARIACKSDKALHSGDSPGRCAPAVSAVEYPGDDSRLGSVNITLSSPAPPRSVRSIARPHRPMRDDGRSTEIADRFGNELASLSTGRTAIPERRSLSPMAAVRFPISGSRRSRRSRVGDSVLACALSKFLEDCPLGDDRGKVYATTNMRTGEAWSLPDLQHMCGGAVNRSPRVRPARRDRESIRRNPVCIST